MTKDKHINDVTQKDYDHVSLLLREASRYDLVWEVKQYAERYIKEGHGYVESFELAYKDWVK